MRKITNYLTIVSLTLTITTGCQEYDLGNTVETITYNDAFINQFGVPSQGHEYGFIEQPIIEDDQTRAVDPNSNMWYSTSLLNVPGYPDANGYFHGTNTTDQNGYLTKYINENDIPADQTGVNRLNWVTNNAGNPVGDVTQEEREYVYNWFATHQNPEGKAIHWSSFFIQYVSSWNEVEKDKPQHNMDQLGYEGILTSWEHVNNFNQSTRAMQYVTNAGTENWTYRASHSNTYQYDKYVIVNLEFDVNGHHYSGWYVAMDYESIKGDANDVYADGYYNDWIVKVSPGTHHGYPTTVRVMCEDLGSSYDWDFNDIVFDVSFRNETTYWPEYSQKTYAKIVLQAVGGTLPVYVGTQDERFEAHKLLGDGSMTPIIHPESVVVYEIEVTNANSSDNTQNAKQIPIYVKGAEATYQIKNSDIAQKFACPDNVEWTEECQNICTKYPNVPTWINDDEAMKDAKDIWIVNPKLF